MTAKIHFKGPLSGNRNNGDSFMFDLSSGTIVVTGGAGLIGSALIWHLNERGIDDIIVVDRLDSSEKWKHLVPLRFRDYVDADDFMDAFTQDALPAATVLHMGACSATTETDADYLIRNNYEYTKALAATCVERDIRFVYASSAATYGALEEDLSETRPLQSLRPLNMYAYSKQLFDLWAARNGLSDSILGLKYFNVFGPNEDHKGDMRSLVCKAFEQIGSRGAVSLFKSYRPEFADGQQQRDFLYVKDAAAMTVFLAEQGTSGIVNVGSGVAHSWVDLVTPIFEAMGVSRKIEFIEMPEVLRAKYQYYTCASTQRLRDAGYDAPVTPLQDAVRDYVSNYLIPGRHLEPHAPAPAASK